MDKNEAIKIIRSNYPTGRNQLCEALETLIPELKESDDEKIRKTLKSFFDSEISDYGNVEWRNGIRYGEIVSWLEKQGKQKPSENKGMNLVEEEMTPFQKKVFFIIDTAIEEEQGLKQVCDELLSLAHDEIMQKPAWSDEDEHILEDIIKEIEANKTAGPEYDEKVYDMFLSWLKSLKVRIQHQHKQEWSEEDWKYYHKLEMFLEVNEHYSKTEKSSGYQKDVHETLSWLKSLKERYTWKPSDEQIEALLKLEEMHVLEHEKNQENAHLYMVIKNIREQLQKLRKE